MQDLTPDQSIPALIREIGDERLEVRPDDLDVETRKNTSTVSASPA